MVPQRFCFFQSSQPGIKKIYKWTKIGHDLRLGYALLSQAMGLDPYLSAKHLSYLLPTISFLCSLADQDQAHDKRALFWAIVNGGQCYSLELSDFMPLTVGAYGLDCYFSHRNDQLRIIEENEFLQSSALSKLMARYAETIYSVVILAAVSCHLFNQNKAALVLFFISLLGKLPYLLYDQQSFSFPSVFNTMLMSFSPIGLFFASKDDFSLIFGLLMTTGVIYLMSEGATEKKQCDGVSQTEEGCQVDSNHISLV